MFFKDRITVDQAALRLQIVWKNLWEKLQDEAAAALEQIETTKKLTAVSKRALQDVCQDFISTKTQV